MIAAKITRVERQVEALGEQLGRIDHRLERIERKPLQTDLTALRTLSERYEEHWLTSNPAWSTTAERAHNLANRFGDWVDEAVDRAPTDFSAVGPVAEAQALAASLRVRAWMAAGEDAAALAAAIEGARAIGRLRERLRIGEMALDRLAMSPIEPGTPAWSEALDQETASLRDSTASIVANEDAAASTAITLAELQRRQISGRAWLEAARGEDEAPLLFLPASS